MYSYKSDGETDPFGAWLCRCWGHDSPHCGMACTQLSWELVVLELGCKGLLLENERSFNFGFSPVNLGYMTVSRYKPQHHRPCCVVCGR